MTSEISTHCALRNHKFEMSPSKYTNVTMDWRLNHLGRLDSPAARMFNRLEAAWFKTPFYAKNYVMCDQLGRNSIKIWESVRWG